VLPPTHPEASYRVRVFTPYGESPYGGHSSLGTATTLVRLGAVAPGPLVQECGPSLLMVSATAEAAVITSTAPPIIADADGSVLAAACGLPDSALTSAVPLAAGLGAAFHFLPVRDSAVADAEPRPADLLAAGLKDVFVFSWNPAERSARARMFAPGYDIPEDPACASAGFGLGVWLVESGALPAGDGTREFVIHQGIEMRRPSTLRCTATVRDGRVVAGTVAGVAIPVGRGEFAAVPGPPGPPHRLGI